MKKIGTKIIACVLLASSTLSIAACGGTGQQGDDTVYITASLAGYRKQWLEGVAEKYTEQTGVTVEIEWDSNLMSNVSNVFDIQTNMSDIYYLNTTGATQTMTWYVTGKLESLNEVFEADNGSGMTIAESVRDEFKQAGVYKGVHYSLPMTNGFKALVYNPDYLEAVGWNHFPDTVDEFAKFCDDINASDLKAPDGTKVKPLVWSGIYTSMSDVVTVMEGQYGGQAEWDAYYGQNGDAPDYNLYHRKSVEVSYDNLQKIMKPDGSGVSLNSLDGSMAKTHTEAQTAFLNGYAAVCTSGSWFETEMGAVTAGKKYKLGKFPLAADENGNYAKEGHSMTKIDPNGPDAPSNYKKFKTSELDGDCMLIPKKAANKQGAKDFMKFMLREENLRYMHEQAGSPFKYKYSYDGLELSAWEQEVMEYDASTISLIRGSSNPYSIFGVLGGARLPEINKACITKNYDYKTNIIDWLWTDVTKNWAERVEVIEGI